MFSFLSSTDRNDSQVRFSTCSGESVRATVTVLCDSDLGLIQSSIRTVGALDGEPLASGLVVHLVGEEGFMAAGSQHHGRGGKASEEGVVIDRVASAELEVGGRLCVSLCVWCQR